MSAKIVNQILFEQKAGVFGHIYSEIMSGQSFTSIASKLVFIGIPTLLVGFPLFLAQGVYNIATEINLRWKNQYTPTNITNIINAAVSMGVVTKPDDIYNAKQALTEACEQAVRGAIDVARSTKTLAFDPADAQHLELLKQALLTSVFAQKVYCGSDLNKQVVISNMLPSKEDPAFRTVKQRIEDGMCQAFFDCYHTLVTQNPLKTLISSQSVQQSVSIDTHMQNLLLLASTVKEDGHRFIHNVFVNEISEAPTADGIALATRADGSVMYTQVTPDTIRNSLAFALLQAQKPLVVQHAQLLGIQNDTNGALNSLVLERQQNNAGRIKELNRQFLACQETFKTLNTPARLKVLLEDCAHTKEALQVAEKVCDSAESDRRREMPEDLVDQVMLKKPVNLTTKAYEAHRNLVQARSDKAIALERFKAAVVALNKHNRNLVELNGAPDENDKDHHYHGRLFTENCAFSVDNVRPDGNEIVPSHRNGRLHYLKGQLQGAADIKSTILRDTARKLLSIEHTLGLAGESDRISREKRDKRSESQNVIELPPSSSSNPNSAVVVLPPPSSGSSFGQRAFDGTLNDALVASSGQQATTTASSISSSSMPPAGTGNNGVTQPAGIRETSSLPPSSATKALPLTSGSTTTTVTENTSGNDEDNDYDEEVDTTQTTSSSQQMMTTASSISSSSMPPAADTGNNRVTQPTSLPPKIRETSSLPAPSAPGSTTTTVVVPGTVATTTTATAGS